MSKSNSIFKVIIAGSRGFNDFKFLCDKCDYLLQNKVKEGYKIAIISGKANGADTYGEKYAKLRGYDIISKPAEWDNLDVERCVIKYNRYNKPYNALAGSNRNNEMAIIADACVIFWDGKSPGSKDMYNICIKRNLPVRLYNMMEENK